MKKLCQIAIYNDSNLQYLENLKGEIEVQKPFSFPVNVQCEVLEFNSQQDFENLQNLVNLEEMNVSITSSEVNQFGSIRLAVKSKLIGVE